MVLQCDIVKKSLSGNNNVIKRFIPDPGGTIIEKGSWMTNEYSSKQTLTLSYSPTSDDLENTFGVVFVQNLQTNKIYQAAKFNPHLFTSNRPIDISDQVSIYPNPVSYNLVIQSEYNIETIQVFDLTGRMVFTAKPQQQKYIMPVEQLRNGLYIVKGTTQKGQFISKIVKQ
jgi:hypothetical protein